VSCACRLVSPYKISTGVIWLETAREHGWEGLLAGICKNDMQNWLRQALRLQGVLTLVFIIRVKLCSLKGSRLVSCLHQIPQVLPAQ
jgi:hypothetical protein